MYRIIKKIGGESVIEVMVAMAIASILIITSIELIGGAYTIVTKTNKRIEAMNLAQEGIEIVRNMRDTNWLRYSGDRRKNWLNIAAAPDDDAVLLDADDDELFVTVNNDGSVTLITDAEVNNIYDNLLNASGSTGEDLTPEELDEINGLFRLYRDAEGIITADSQSGTLPASDYLRVVKITPNCSNTATCDKKINVTSEVFWNLFDSNDFDRTEVISELYDFYELE